MSVSGGPTAYYGPQCPYSTVGISCGGPACGGPAGVATASSSIEGSSRDDASSSGDAPPSGRAELGISGGAHPIPDTGDTFRPGPCTAYALDMVRV